MKLTVKLSTAESNRVNLNVARLRMHRRMSWYWRGKLPIVTTAELFQLGEEIDRWEEKTNKPAEEAQGF